MPKRARLERELGQLGKERQARGENLTEDTMATRMSKETEAEREALVKALADADLEALEAQNAWQAARKKKQAAQEALDAFDREQERKVPLEAWEQALLEAIATGSVQTIAEPYLPRHDRPRHDWNVAHELHRFGFITIVATDGSPRRQVAITDAGRARLQEG